jgi:ribonucleoside-diphosphate reductase beta chain
MPDDAFPRGSATQDELPIRFDLLTSNPVYKPFRYPWAYEAWLQQQRIHWLPEEVPLADDVKDWQKNLTRPSATCSPRSSASSPRRMSR